MSSTVLSPLEVLERFLGDEEVALAQGSSGSYYPSNHHRIKPLVSRAPRMLDTDRRVSLYFHLLRHDVCPSLKSDLELDLLKLAYERVKPLFSVGHPALIMSRAKGLFLFGSNDCHWLAEGSGFTISQYRGRLSFWRHVDSFWHMTGMLSKQDKFAQWAQDRALLARAAEVLHSVQLERDLIFSSQLWFWALLLLTLQEEATARVAVDWLLRARCANPMRAELINHLSRYLAAAGRPELLAFGERQI